jgi:hypothetical protein
LSPASDSSTTATKVEIRELDSGRVVGRGSSPHPPTQPPRSEQEPAAWWAAFVAAWRQAGEPAVAGISVAGQQHRMPRMATRQPARRHRRRVVNVLLIPCGAMAVPCMTFAKGLVRICGV